LSTQSSGVPARAAAQKILSEVLRKRRPLDAVQDDVIAQSGLEPRDAGFARAIAGETLRRFGQIEALIRAFVPKSPPPHRAGPTLEILMAGACELLFLGVAPHAAVDAANNLAAADAKAVHFKPLINAVMRRVSKEGAAMLAGKDAARLNTPDWLWQRWSHAYGDTAARAIAGAHTQQPPTDFVLRGPDAPVPEGAAQLFDNVYRLGDTGRVDLLDGFAQGGWWVQDFAATLPVRLLGDVAGKRVADLCAAPGGKTMQLCAAGAAVTAVDISARRLIRLGDNLARSGLSAELVTSDVAKWATAEKFDAVLLDAPCSGTGTLRRHPDIAWLKSEEDIARLALAQDRLLLRAVDLLKPGGTLVYATCSLQEDEGPARIDSLLARDKRLRRVPAQPHELPELADALTSPGDVRTLPSMWAERGGLDGFYMARLAL
jgi:16S rRNA (cytosine967-C5)-methyltransferase